MVECNFIECDSIECSCIDSTKCNSIEFNSIQTSNLNNQQFRLNKINEMKNYFIAEINERELTSKRLSKYIASFDYFDKSLIVLSATNGSISFALFATVIGTPVGIASPTLSLTFSLSTGIAKKLLKTTRNKKKKHHNIIVMLARSINSIESNISETLMNNQDSHEDFMTIINEERNYRELKEGFRMMKGQEDKKIDID